MVFLSSIIFFVIGLMVGFLALKKCWQMVWFKDGYDAGYQAFQDERVVTIKDTLPEKQTKKNLVLKLQNELMNYVTVTEDSVEIQVIKKESDVSETDENVED